MSISVIQKEQSEEVKTTSAKKTKGINPGIVDEYAQLDDKIKARRKSLKALEGRKAKLDILFQEKANSLVGEAESTEIKGGRFLINFGPRASRVESIDKKKAKKFLGDKLFFQLASLKVGDLRQYLTPPQLDKVLNEVRDGKRSVSTVKL